jgi:acyl-CoA synthetase (AMP-forming)/AMP-acid ligase II
VTWQTIPEMVLSAADRFGTAEAVVDGPVRLTFAELADRVRVAAGAFASAGIETGDRVAIWAPNSAEWIIAAFGLLTAGGVLVPVNTRFKAAEAGDIIGRSGAKAVLVQKGFLGLEYEGPPGVPVIPLTSGFLSSGAPLEREVGVDDVCDIVFTSGTTGRPKGVLVRAEHLAAALARRGPVPRRALIRTTLADIAGGAQALSELDFCRLTRRFGLPEPSRQALRKDERGRVRWLDACWERERLVVEVDGLWHMDAAAWWADMHRDNELTLSGYRVLRFPAFAVRDQPEVVAAQIADALRLAGEPG